MKPAFHAQRGFTLLEVMIAIGIFFMATFVILDLVSQNLRAAHAIKPSPVDVGSVVSDLMLTNRIEEGTQDGDFGEVCPGYAWVRSIVLVSTNGLYQVDVAIIKTDAPGSEPSKMSLLLYRPESKTRGGVGSVPGGPR
jgi:Tfp pilus assembly protein PilV